VLLLGTTITVDGITVFPDHADPNQFWCLIGPVALAQQPGVDQPVFTLITFRPAAVQAGVQGGGFLMFQTALTLAADTRQRIMDAISALAPGEARLSQATFDDGTVRCVALNVEGSGGTVANPAPPGTFDAVEEILGASVPSLEGDNDAIFSLVLSQQGAIILKSAFEQGAQPIGVIYDLTFTGIRPALDVKITADLKRVYDAFSASLSATIYYVQVGVEAMLERLQQDGAIQIEVITFSDDADLEQKKEWALDFFRDKLLTEWFTPSLSPVAQASSGTAVPGSTNPKPFPGRPGTPGTPPPAPPSKPSASPKPPGQSPPAPASPAASPPAAPASPAASPPAAPASPAAPPPAAPASPAAPPPSPPAGKPGAPGQAGGGGSQSKLPAPVASAPVSLKLRFVDQQELKTIVYTYHEQEAVKRRYAPQGFFGIMGAALDASHFVDVDLNDPFFQQLSIEIAPPLRPDAIGLIDSHISIDYVDSADSTNRHSADLTFAAADTVSKTESFFLTPSLDLTYAYNLTYNFDPGSDWLARDNSYTLPPATQAARYLRLDPRTSLGFLQIKVVPGTIDKALITQVDVHLHYEDPNGWSQDTTLIVTPGGATQLWKLRTSNPAATSFQYSLLHHLADGSTRPGDPQTVTTTVPTVLVNDPFPDYLQLVFIPLFDATVREVFIDITYDDPANTYHRTERLIMTGATPTDQSIRLALIDPTLTTYTYQFTFVTTDNHITQKAPVTTTETIIGVAP
jgi:hypothetical protein